MSIVSKLFSKNKEKKYEKEEFIEESVSNVQKDLYLIENTILKLELINSSHGKTEYLTQKISFYRNKVKELNENYKKWKSNDTFLTLSDGEMNYRVGISILADEIDAFSKIYFYLEELNTFWNQEITLSNFFEKKKELLELENKIKEYRNSNLELSKKLCDSFINTIFYFLKQEVKLGCEQEFYRQLSEVNQLQVQKRYFEELVIKAESDLYIQAYLKENDIGTLRFDYEMFAYLVLGKLIEEKSEILENQTVGINENVEVTILGKDQIFGSNQLNIFEKREASAVTSDYVICCGGNSSLVYFPTILESRTGCYLTKTDNGDNGACAVDYYGKVSSINVQYRYGGVRPALSFSSISNICYYGIRAEDGILKVEYGEYPQKAASKRLQRELERLFQSGSLVKTGKRYTRDSVGYNECHYKFQKEMQEEYEYQGKKYVRVKVNSCYAGDKFILSNEKMYRDGDFVWIEVEPIKWLVDEKNDIAVSEKLLFAGIQFKHTREYKGDFENTDLKWYLDTYFSKEIIPSDIQLNKDSGVKQLHLTK